MDEGRKEDGRQVLVTWLRSYGRYVVHFLFCLSTTDTRLSKHMDCCCTIEVYYCFCYLFLFFFGGGGSFRSLRCLH